MKRAEHIRIDENNQYQVDKCQIKRNISNALIINLGILNGDQNQLYGLRTLTTKGSINLTNSTLNIIYTDIHYNQDHMKNLLWEQIRDKQISEG